ncbi:MAG TPA: hypothetical protein VGE09_08335 [Pseudoxanthomonas sp.]
MTAPTKSEHYVDHITMAIGVGFYACLIGVIAAMVGFALAVMK